VVNALIYSGNEKIGFLRAVVYITRICSIAHEIWTENRDTISFKLKLQYPQLIFSASGLIRDNFDRLDEIRIVFSWNKKERVFGKEYVRISRKIQCPGERCGNWNSEKNVKEVV
jgi:hypothetical protein